MQLSKQYIGDFIHCQSKMYLNLSEFYVHKEITQI